MGLYINNEKHNDLFKNEARIVEPNQSYFKRDHFEELVKGQLKVNEALHHSIHGLKNLYNRQESVQTNRWNEIGNSLKEIKEINEKDQGYVVNRLKNLESDNKKLQKALENDRFSEKELMDQVGRLSQSNQVILDQLEAYCLENEEFKSKTNEQFELQKKMSDKITKQDEAQDEVLSRLENQEALTEKITRQIDYFRSILFERTNYLAEKIESGYNHTSSYLANLINGSEPTSKNFRLNQREEEHKIHK